MYANGAGDWDTNGAATITGIDNLTINSTLGVTGASLLQLQWIWVQLLHL